MVASLSPTPSIRIFPDPTACAEAAAQLFLQLSLAAAEAHHPFRVALSGGSTPKRLYSILAENPAFRDHVPWSKVHFFFSDERNVPPDHADSNFGLARNELFSKVAVPAANIHRVWTERSGAVEAAALYQNAIAASFRGNKNEVPRFDLIFLGMGPDGHTASLFPDTEALNEQQQWVTANWVEKLKTQRITFTYPLLNQAAHVVLLVTGAEKAERIETILNPAVANHGNSPISLYPVQRVQPTQGVLEWYLDEAAARLLKNDRVEKAEQATITS